PRLPTAPRLFPYPTLFRSERGRHEHERRGADAGRGRRPGDGDLDLRVERGRAGRAQPRGHGRREGRAPEQEEHPDRGPTARAGRPAHASPFSRAATCTARTAAAALLRDSAYSSAGTESATMPPPAWTLARPSRISAVRIAIAMSMFPSKSKYPAVPP